MSKAAKRAKTYSVRVGAERVQVVGPDGAVVGECLASATDALHFAERWAHALNGAFKLGFEAGRRSVTSVLREGTTS